METFEGVRMEEPGVANPDTGENGFLISEELWLEKDQGKGLFRVDLSSFYAYDRVFCCLRHAT